MRPKVLFIKQHFLRVLSGVAMVVQGPCVWENIEDIDTKFPALYMPHKTLSINSKVFLSSK